MKNRLTIKDHIEIIQETLGDIPEEIMKDIKERCIEGKKYMYVKATHKDINNGEQFIGLFRGGDIVGKGHFCGWYSEEYLRFTRCLAVNKVFYNKFLTKISISTMICIKYFRARNDKEARQKFIQIISEKEDGE